MAPSKSKAKRMAQKAEASASGSTDSLASSVSNLSLSASASLTHLKSECTVTGVLTSRQQSRDIKFENFFLNYRGRELIADATLELNFGRRYGLIGANGSGKSTLLACIAEKQIPLPPHIDVYLLSEEVEPSEKTALEAVIESVLEEQGRLEKEAERILIEEGPESENLQDIYDRLDKMDSSTFNSRAGALLFGLGFTKSTMEKMTKDLSGGWRMRVALAKALFIRPTLLLLDEPTNHLDLEACVWLEDYLSRYDRTLLIISHSQDFLNGVCTNIINLRRSKLFSYTGNYDTYVKTRAEVEANQMKQYAKQQEDIAHIKAFIASCGTYSNLVRQGKSKQKILDKMEADGLIEKVIPDSVVSFHFPSCGKIPPPVLSFNSVSFSYSGNPKDFLYENLDFGVDLDSRIALVGPNGVGKSTLLKLMCHELTAVRGQVRTHTHLRIGRYQQHFINQLDMSKSPLDYIRDTFPDIEMEEEQWRAQLGRFGVTGQMQKQPIATLSDGQKSRIVFAEISMRNPHMLLLDEPTNHLDMDCIDSLASAINGFDGGLVLVSHDFRLIKQVAKEIWVCDKKTVTKWTSTIEEYKEMLKRGFTKL